MTTKPCAAQVAVILKTKTTLAENHAAESHIRLQTMGGGGSRSWGEAGRYQSRGLPSFLVANLTHPRGAGHAGEIILRKDYLPTESQPAIVC